MAIKYIVKDACCDLLVLGNASVLVKLITHSESQFLKIVPPAL